MAKSSGKTSSKKKKRKKRTKKPLKKKKHPIKKKIKKTRKIKKTKKTRAIKTKKKEMKGKVKIKKKEQKKPKINIGEKREVLNLFSDAYARQVMITLGGENALEVIRTYPYCVSDEEISRKLKVKISDVRSTLNRMHGEGFVAYTRKKDSETGWYSYSWSLNKKNIVEWVKRINKEKDKLFNPEIEKYYCKKCGLDSLVGFVNASNNNFKCSCCNGNLEFLEKNKVDQLFGKLVPNQMRKRRNV